MIFNMSGVGGIELSTFVSSYSSASDLPTSAKLNAVGIISDTETTSWDFSPKEPYKRSNNKNLIIYPFYNTTKTTNGVTFTDNGDGTLTLNGTASAAAYFNCSYSTNSGNLMYLTAGTYTLYNNSGTSNCYVAIRGSYDGGATWETIATSYATSKTITLTSDIPAYIVIGAASGKTFSNLTISPQLERGGAATSFVKGSANGQVWICTDATGTIKFNVIKDNGIYIYPTSAKQYITNQWVDVDAHFYRSGTWIQIGQS